MAFAAAMVVFTLCESGPSDYKGPTQKKYQAVTGFMQKKMNVCSHCKVASKLVVLPKQDHHVIVGS